MRKRLFGNTGSRFALDSRLLVWRSIRVAVAGCVVGLSGRLRRRCLDDQLDDQQRGYRGVYRGESRVWEILLGRW